MWTGLADRPGFESNVTLGTGVALSAPALMPSVIQGSSEVTLGMHYSPSNNSLCLPTLSNPTFLPLSKHALNLPALVPLLTDTYASPGPPSACPSGPRSPARGPSALVCTSHLCLVLPCVCVCIIEL